MVAVLKCIHVELTFILKFHLVPYNQLCSESHPKTAYSLYNYLQMYVYKLKRCISFSLFWSGLYFKLNFFSHYLKEQNYSVVTRLDF